jgi:hypothetical protein
MRSLLCFVLAAILVCYIGYVACDAQYLYATVRQATSHPFIASLGFKLSLSLAGLGAFISFTLGCYQLRKE